MTKPEWRMTNEPCKRLIKWMLAVWEGALFGWFVFMILVAIQNVIRVVDFLSRPSLDDKWPRLTVWIQNVFPEESWSLMTGTLAFSVGFGLVSLTSSEAPSGRLFRWAVIAALTMLVGVALPVTDRYTNLSGGPDERMWDEVLFVGLALFTLVYGVVRLRRPNHKRP
jgi:hypothetical protein